MAIIRLLLIVTRKHVFRDLQPYTCLDESCPVPNQDFKRRKDWLRHMKQDHWRVWAYPFGCDADFPSSLSLRQHLSNTHPTAVAEENLDSLVLLSSGSRFQNTQAICPLCHDFNIGSIRQYEKHVGHHLQQLALFALPHLDELGDQAKQDEPKEREVEYMNIDELDHHAT